MNEDKGDHHAAYVLLSSKAKASNLGNLIRSSVGFGVQAVLIIGNHRFSTHGAHGSDKHMTYINFTTWLDAAKYVKEEQNCDLYALMRYAEDLTDASGSGSKAGTHAPAASVNAMVNNEDGAGGEKKAGKQDEDQGRQRYAVLPPLVPIHTRPFRRSSAFLLRCTAVDGEDPSWHAALALCETRLFIPQAVTPPVLLELGVVLSITLHHFTAWAGYTQRQLAGEKFVVDATIRRGDVRSDDVKKTERTQRREQAARDAVDPTEVAEEDGLQGSSLWWCGGLDDDDNGQVHGEDEVHQDRDSST